MARKATSTIAGDHEIETLSKLLAQIDLRGQTWCYSDIGVDGGISLPPSRAVIFHSAIHGSVRVDTVLGRPIELAAGESIFVLSGEGHALRPPRSTRAVTQDFLREERSGDSPSSLDFAQSGRVAARILSGRFEATWPSALDRSDLPRMVPIGRAAASASIFHANALAIAGTGSGSSALLTKIASLMLAAELRTDADFTRKVEPGESDPITRAVALIKAQPAKAWTVEKLAQAVGMGRSCFAEQFTRKAGRPPMEMLTQLRMENAAKLVRQGKLKIAEISELAGYASETAFTRRFSRQFGTSPRQMRELCLESQSPPAACLSSPHALILRMQVPARAHDSAREVAPGVATSPSPALAKPRMLFRAK